MKVLFDIWTIAGDRASEAADWLSLKYADLEQASLASPDSYSGETVLGIQSEYRKQAREKFQVDIKI